MGLLDFLNPKRSNPFTSEEYYDRDELEVLDYSPKEMAGMRDTRELGLGPVRIADGVAISRDGYFSAALQVGTVNFALATAEEQEAIVGGYHAVLRQLSGGNYQIKVRMVEADLEPLVARVDYALSTYASAPLHRLALQYKQFLREELPKRLVLMERRNYVIVSVYSPLLVKMARIYEHETNKPATLFAGLGKQWREEENRTRLEASTSPVGRKDESKVKSKKSRGKKAKTLTPVEQRREQLLKARAEDEMEQKMYEEAERTLRQLKHQLNVLVAGLGSNGLALRRLNDWELTALYAEYLRPELAQEVRHSLSAPIRSQLRQANQGPLVPQVGKYGQAVRPLSLSEFMGEQSGTVVVSDPLENSAEYKVGSVRATSAMTEVTSNDSPPRASNQTRVRITPNSDSPVKKPQTLDATKEISGLNDEVDLTPITQGHVSEVLLLQAQKSKNIPTPPGGSDRIAGSKLPQPNSSRVVRRSVFVPTFASTNPDEGRDLVKKDKVANQ
jgi:hypothetical protein